MLKGEIILVSLKEIGHFEDLEETQATLEGNSLQKARFISDKYKIDCFSEDSGLEVPALNNEPGVYSARYAGPRRNDRDNIDLLLKNLQDQVDRSARFKTVITLIINKKEYQFTGIVRGKIISSPRGENGFGYDPVFVPEGEIRTFAEMALDEKNQISHRSKATHQLKDFLNSLSIQ